MGAADVDEALAVTVEVTTRVITLAMVGATEMVSSERTMAAWMTLDYPRIQNWRGQRQVLSGVGAGKHEAGSCF